MPAALLVVVLMVLPVSFAEAQTVKIPPSVPQPPQPPRSQSGAAKACSEYGAGFIRLEGTSTCVRSSGSIAVEGRAGASR